MNFLSYEEVRGVDGLSGLNKVRSRLGAKGHKRVVDSHIVGHVD